MNKFFPEGMNKYDVMTVTVRFTCFIHLDKFVLRPSSLCQVT